MEKIKCPNLCTIIITLYNGFKSFLCWLDALTVQYDLEIYDTLLSA